MKISTHCDYLEYPMISIEISLLKFPFLNSVWKTFGFQRLQIRSFPPHMHSTANILNRKIYLASRFFFCIFEMERAQMFQKMEMNFCSS